MSQVITIDDLTAYSPTAIDSGRGQLVVDAMNQWVETRTNRVWGTSVTVTERYDWGKTLWLRHQDVTAITSIKVGWPNQTQTTLDPTGYFFNNFGRVTLLMQALGNLGGANTVGSPFYNDYLEVIYTYGNASVPDDLKMAVLAIAANFYNWAQNGQRDVSAVSVGSYSVQYASKRQTSSGTAEPATNTADANWSIIDSYRQRRA